MTVGNTLVLIEEREQLTLAWKALAHVGVIDYIFNHISIAQRDSAGQMHFVINPDGMLASEVKPDTTRVLPVRDYDTSEAAIYGVNADGLRLHSLIHSRRARPGAVIHTHAPHSIAVGCSTQGLLPITQTAMEFTGDVTMLEYGGLFRSHRLTSAIESFVDAGGCALLRHHGMLVVADSVAEAVYLTLYLEEACRLQVLALSQGVPLTQPDDAAIEAAKRALRRDRETAAVKLFAALCRSVEAR